MKLAGKLLEHPADDVVVVGLPPGVSGDATLTGLDRIRFLGLVVETEHHHGSDTVQYMLRMLVSGLAAFDVSHLAREAVLNPLDQIVEAGRGYCGGDADQVKSEFRCAGADVSG